MTPLICRHCGLEFADPRPFGTRGRKPAFCSAACRAEHRRDYNRDYNAGRISYRRLHDLCIDCPETDLRAAVPNTDFCVEHAARREATASKQMLARYGLTVETFTALYERQDGRCAICGVRESENSRRLSVDHDHACCAGDASCGSCVRGLLCSGCNTGLGMFRDRADVLRAAVDYLTTSE